jgi:hypothetical protein
MAFCGKSEIMEHVLKMQHISLLPKYIKQISLGALFYVHLHTKMQVV